jgi:hypothetical protein
VSVLSIAQRCLEHIRDALLEQPYMLDVIDRVEMGRPEPFSREELIDGPAINIRRGDETTEAIGGFLGNPDTNEFTAEVDIYCREDDWQTTVDRVAVEVHGRLSTWPYAGIRIGGQKPRKSGSTVDVESADATAGKLTVRYVFQFFTLSGDISAQP